MTKSGLEAAATGTKIVGTSVVAGAVTATNMASTKLEEVGVTQKVNEGVGFVKQKTG